MEKFKTLNAIVESGVVAVIRAESKEQGKLIIEAVKNGGIKALEITMTVPGAVNIIDELTTEYANEDVIIGAGTVLDPETARACILAGAKYIVSPYFDEATAKLCNRYAIPYMPGIMTPKEAVAALEFGVDILKVFPGSAFGPSIIKGFKGPIPQGNYMPTGGVSLENIGEWVSAGAIACGTGSSLTKGANTGDYDAVTKAAADFVKAFKDAKANA